MQILKTFAFFIFIRCMEEIWKDIPGYEGLYKVSNLGNVLSLNNYRRSNSKILKQHISKSGYHSVVLSKNQIKKTYRVHRLVAMVFIPNPDNLPFINHKDENKANNCVDNLEWCTDDYNRHYGTMFLRAKLSNIKSRGRKVACYNLKGEFIKEYEYINQAKIDGHDRSGIIPVCKGFRNTYHCLIWKYI